MLSYQLFSSISLGSIATSTSCELRQRTSQLYSQLYVLAMPFFREIACQGLPRDEADECHFLPNQPVTGGDLLGVDLHPNWS